MTQENENVLPTSMMEVTPAQEALLDLVQSYGAKHLMRSVRHVKEFVLYLATEITEQEDLPHCSRVNDLENALKAIAKERKKEKRNLNDRK